MTYKEDDRYFDERLKCKVKCKCGHKVAIPSFKNKKLCDWCGHYVYKEQKDEFKDALLKKLKV